MSENKIEKIVKIEKITKVNKPCKMIAPTIGIVEGMIIWGIAIVMFLVVLPLMTSIVR